MTFLVPILETAYFFTSVVKQAKAAAVGSGGWPSAAVCHPHDKALRSFQRWKNKP